MGNFFYKAGELCYNKYAPSGASEPHKRDPTTVFFVYNRVMLVEAFIEMIWGGLAACLPFLAGFIGVLLVFKIINDVLFKE